MNVVLLSQDRSQRPGSFRALLLFQTQVMQQCSVNVDNNGGLFCRGLNVFLGLSAKPGVLGKKSAMVLHVAWNNRAVSCNQ